MPNPKPFETLKQTNIVSLEFGQSESRIRTHFEQRSQDLGQSLNKGV